MPTEGSRLCQYCNVSYLIQGIGRHEKACPEQQNQATRSTELAELLQRRETEALAAQFAQKHRLGAEASAAVRDPPLYEPRLLHFPEENYDFVDIPPEEPTTPEEPARPEGPQMNDIKREFHPHSGRKPIKQTFQEYRASQVRPDRTPPTDSEPWSPFRTRLDFEVSEFAQEAMLNQRQIDTFISLIRRCAANISAFTLHSHSDMNKSWDLASKKCTEFQRFEVPVPYKGVDQVFEMYARPLWDWTLDLIQDPHLADFFVWDAERAYRFDGKKYVRFFTEPWTANAMWDTQSKIPKGRDIKTCPYIIYADKAKLSSFGTQKGYPIVARLANLVVSLRNSSDWGGGQIVGWLPVVVEDEAEAGKPGYVNFKNAVWHQSFYKLLESIVSVSKTGAWIRCGDGLQRCLYPMILILASDYEEACVMTLIRGLRSLYPCPICYVKQADQSDITQTPGLRTSQHSQKVVQQARKLNAEGRETLLKAHGLRDVDNVFWKVAYSDPHYASSFEHLHGYASGLWGKHLFEQIKKHVELLPGRVAAQIDQQFKALPRWRGLNHFASVMSTTFNDGSKHEDVSKQILLASHNVFTDPHDLALLKVIRSYQELNAYVTLKLHTTETIAAGRAELENFGELMNLYIDTCDEDDKNWDFPKMHGHTHVFDDIERKGAARNFGTKIDEAMHGSARSAYLRQTNFKNVAPQILKSEHRRLVGKFIRDQLNDLDQIFRRECEGAGTEDAGAEDEDPDDLEAKLGNVAVGSVQKPTSFAALQQEMKHDPAFDRFRIKLSIFLTNFLQAYDHPLPGGKAVKLLAQDTITPHRFLKIFYQSLDDWADEADYLRCSPSFHGHPRFDGALVKTTTRNIFVRLIYVFKITLGEKSKEKTYPFALVQPLDAPIGRVTAKDKALKLIRVRAKARVESEFISVHSIIRGVVLAPAFDREGDYMVMDVADGDMFLRLKDHVPKQI
ncbi:hypothetical protein DFH09DRAFT_1193954 [Mycena vulgaris]|nr:hypothetical protein DFH09DRAFT_1193954 [Mycena vulgaris]